MRPPARTANFTSADVPGAAMPKTPKKICKSSEKEKSPVRKFYFGEKDEEIRILGRIVFNCSDGEFVRAERSRALRIAFAAVFNGVQRAGFNKKREGRKQTFICRSA